MHTNGVLFSNITTLSFAKSRYFSSIFKKVPGRTPGQNFFLPLGSCAPDLLILVSKQKETFGLTFDYLTISKLFKKVYSNLQMI